MGQNARKLIAKNLKYYREQKNLTRECLSLALGFDNSYIGKVEQCKVNITIDRMEKIASFLKIAVGELLK